MVTWVGVLGKILEFLVTKLAGKKIDLALDSKKHACKLFLDCYEAIIQLEDVTEELLRELEPVVNGRKSRLYGSRMEPLSKKIDAASNIFFESTSKLGAAIAIYDPDLARMISRVQMGKGRALLLASTLFDRERIYFEVKLMKGKKSLESIRYTLPNEEAERVDLDLVYDEIRASSQKGPLGVWGPDVLAKVFKGRVIDDDLLPDEVAKIRYLSKHINRHLSVLTQAREALGGFIKNEFTIEDLLYVMN